PHRRRRCAGSPPPVGRRGCRCSSPCGSRTLASGTPTIERPKSRRRQCGPWCEATRTSASSSRTPTARSWRRCTSDPLPRKPPASGGTSAGSGGRRRTISRRCSTLSASSGSCSGPGSRFGSRRTVCRSSACSSTRRSNEPPSSRKTPAGDCSTDRSTAPDRLIVAGAASVATAREAKVGGADALLAFPRPDDPVGYHAALSGVLPVIAFYLYEAAGGVPYDNPTLHAILELPGVIGIKVATL